MLSFDPNTDYRLSISPQELDLAVTLDCGQCFRFQQEPDGSFYGIAFGEPLRLRQDADSIVFYKTSEEDFKTIWKPYFDLDTDYAAIRDFLSVDDTMAKAIAFAPGIRILRQSPFEALVSFLISQNNNIPRIKTSIQRLCEQFGRPLAEDGFAFPEPEALWNLEKEDLAGLGLGYRDGYLLDCVRRIRDGRLDLNRIAALPLADARTALLQIKGVGVKVAECVLLFGFHRLDAFPIDTWMKKALAAHYPAGFPAAFHEVAGIAQQYLFHYIRFAAGQ